MKSRSVFAPKAPHTERHLYSRTPLPTTTRTPYARAQKRREKGLASSLDLWLEKAIAKHQDARLDASLDAPPSIFDQDLVDCETLVHKQEGASEGPFQDPHTFKLFMRLHLPKSSGVLVYFQVSPWVLVATFEDHGDELFAPFWVTDMPPRTTFQENRAHAIELMAVLARHPIQSDSSSAENVVIWCHQVSRLITDPRESPCTVYYQDRTSSAQAPEASRSHKPRAYELTADESNAYRQSIMDNEGSLPRRQDMIK